jgi:signal transduction histidine kinase
MPNSYQKEGKLNFSVDSQLLFELGEQLVAKPSIALAELVKNAYDADATQVKVIFDGIGERVGSIIVEDNGHGMTFDEIERGWMRIAASLKRTSTTSRVYQRSLTGAKGIGRFATRRLGKKLELQSVVELPDGTKEAIAIKFDWSDFTSGTEISEVPVTYKRVIAPNDHPTGVELHILDTHDVWTSDDIEGLKKDLTGLISPFPVVSVIGALDRDPGFNVILEIEGEETTEVESDLSEEFLDSGWAVLEGKIDENGLAVYDIDFLRTENKSEQLKDEIENYTKLKEVSFKIYYHLFESSSDYSHLSFSVGTARKLGREQGGVRIYLDTFRVYPYGETSDDWLRLAELRSRNVDMAGFVAMSNDMKEYGKNVDRPFLQIPGNNNLFGYVHLSQLIHANSDLPIGERLNIKASREGFSENFVFEQLRRFLQRGIYWLTMQYASIRASSGSKENTRKSKESIRETKKDLDALPSRIADKVAEVASRPRQSSLLQDETQKQIEQEKIKLEILEAVTPEVSAIRANMDTVEAGYESEQQQLISVIAMLRLLASAGTSLLVMNHQLSPIQHMASGIKFDLEQLESSIHPDVHQDYLNVLTQIEDWQNIVDAVVTPLTSLLSVENRERRKRWVLYETVDEIRKSLSYYMRENNIEFINDVPPGLRTPLIYRAELYAIMLNLLTNALKAVHGYPERKIRVLANKVDGNLNLHMLNTGKKAPQEKWQSFFRPFITDSISEAGLGVGTGLGLSVIRDTVDEYGGRAQFIEVEQSWQTGLEIILPYRDEK